MSVTPPAASRMASIGHPEPTSGDTPVEGTDILFEALLKGFDKILEFQEEGRSAIHPEIGESAESFLEAALPASTALPLAAATKEMGAALDRAHAAIDTIRPATRADQAVHLLARVAEALHAWLASPATGSPVSASHASVTAPALQAASAPANLPTLSPSLPAPNIRPTRLPDGMQGLVASLRLPGRSNADPSASPATSPFAAHLLDLEGQLRLVLKLPKLPEDQRQDLEARLRRLLEEFGHYRPDLVIREAGRTGHG